MPAVFSAFIAGLLFSLGLTISQMVNPAKILSFLDVAGKWDPSLLLVLGGAVLASFAGTRIVTQRMRAPIFAERFGWPTATDVDRNLIAGAVIFGVGWGLVGFCPGPALAALAIAPIDAAPFLIAMLAGMVLYRISDRLISAPPPATADG